MGQALDTRPLAHTADHHSPPPHSPLLTHMVLCGESRHSIRVCVGLLAWVYHIAADPQLLGGTVGQSLL